MGLFASVFGGPGRQVARARQLFDDGRFDAAASLLDKAIPQLQRRYPDGADTLANLQAAWLIEGRLALRGGDKQAAVRAFFACPDLAAKEAAAVVLLVTESAALEVVPAELEPVVVAYACHGAMATLDRDFAANDAGVRALLRPAGTTRWTKPPAAERIETLNRVVADTNTHCGWCREHLAEIAARRGDWKTAQARASEALTLDQGHEVARRVLALAHAETGDTDAALSVLRGGEGRPASRQALLLKAQLETVHGDHAAAVASYQAAGAIKPLDERQTLALADGLLRSGQRVAAEGILAPLLRRADPPAEAVLAYVDSCRHPTRKMIELVAPLASGKQDRDALLASIWSLAARTPEHPLTLDLLATVPDAARNERHYRLLGMCLAAAGRHADAIEAWSTVLGADAHVLRAMRQCRMAAVKARLDAGDGAGALAELTRAARMGADAADVAMPLTGALRLAVVQAGAKPAEGRSKTDMSAEPRLSDMAMEILAIAPALAHSAEIAEPLGRLLVGEGRFAEALKLLSPCASPTAVLDATFAALRLGDVAAAEQLLERVPAEVPGRPEVAALVAMMLGDAAKANALLAAAAPQSELRAIVASAAGDHAALAGAGAGGVWSYLGAVEHLRHGRRAEAEREIAAVAADSPCRPGADALTGWLMLSDAVTAARAGDHRGAATLWLGASQLWPGARAAKLAPPALEDADAQLALLVMAGDREELRSALHAAAQLAGGLDARSSHRLLVCLVADGVAAARFGRAPEALKCLEAAIGHLGVGLFDDDYFERWLDDRCAGYHIERPEFDLKAAITTAMTELLLAAVNAAGSGGATTGSGGGSCGKAGAALPQLPLLLDAETWAADALARAGGFSARATGYQRRAFGPTAIAATEEFCDFGGFVRGLAKDAGADNRNDCQLEWLSPGGGEGHVPTATEIALAFSSLRLPALLMRRGEPDRALAQLDPTRSFTCYPLAALQDCVNGPASGCAGRDGAFAACNPAFAGEGGVARLAETARRLRLAALLRAARLRLEATPPALGELRHLWDEAMKLARATGLDAEATDVIRALAMGRAATLREKGSERSEAEQLADASELLATACAVCDDGELKSEYASALADTAIDEANRTQDFGPAVESLRKALSLAPHNTRVRRNLVIGTQHLSSQTFEKDKRRAASLLDDAHGVASRWLEEDPHNQEVDDVLVGVERDMILLNHALALDSIGKDEKTAVRHLVRGTEIGIAYIDRSRTGSYADAMLQALGECADHLSKWLANTGIDLANSSTRYQQAADHLRAARLVMPGSLHVVRNLVVLLRNDSIGTVGTNYVRAGKLMLEAAQIGRQWLKDDSDAELHQVVLRCESDYDTIVQNRQWSMSRSDFELDATTRDAVLNPSLHKAMAMIRRMVIT